MAIIKEYRCRDCGTTFESMDADPECPTCTGDSERAFLTPPNINSGNTRRADTIQKELAADFGMSDMSNKHGQAVRKTADSPAKFAGDSRIMQNLSRLGGTADNFSGVLPTLQQYGNPKSWQKTPARKH